MKRVLRTLGVLLLVVYIAGSGCAIGYAVQDIWPRETEQAFNKVGDIALNWKGKL